MLTSFCFDLIRREVRLIRRAGRTTALVVRYGFEELSAAEDLGDAMRLRDPDGEILADVPMDHPQTRKSLMRGLRDAGKLLDPSHLVQPRAEPV